MTQFRPPRQRRSRGFGMLEVIAALVILSLGASVAFTWLAQTMSTIGRLRAQEAELIARAEVIEYVRSLNPRAAPSGSEQVAQYRIEWSSVEARPALPARNRFNANGIFSVSLHDVHANIYDAAGRLWFSMDLPVAGYEQRSRAGDLSPLQLQAPTSPK